MHPYYENCARMSIVTVSVYRKHIDPQTTQGPRLLVLLLPLKVHTTNMEVLFYTKSLKFNKHGNFELLTVEMHGVVVHMLDHELYKSCRTITGCLKPTQVEDLSHQRSEKCLCMNGEH